MENKYQKKDGKSIGHKYLTATQVQLVPGNPFFPCRRTEVSRAGSRYEKGKGVLTAVMSPSCSHFTTLRKKVCMETGRNSTVPCGLESRRSWTIGDLISVDLFLLQSFMD